MFSISIVDVAMGLYVIGTLLALKTIVYVVRQLVAIRNVKVAYKALARWNRRYDWAVENDVFTDAQGFQWTPEEIEVVLQTRKAAFNKAVDSRDLIRF